MIYIAYKIAIDANGGGQNSGITTNNLIEKDYSLNISKYINDRLNELGVENFLVRTNDTNISTDDRANIIKNKYGNGNNVIVISNRLNENDGTEIIYPLRSNSKLASMIANELNSIGLNVTKYYQLRDNTDTALDEDLLIRNTPNNQTIVIKYNSDDNNFLLDNINNIGEAVVKAISNYAGVNYIPNLSDNYYVVQKGDTLYSIAVKNNTTVGKSKEINKLTSNALQIGQILILQSNNENNVNATITYTVVKGDSLWAIANKYDTTVDKIKSVNNLSSNILQIGQKLIIPSTSNFITYTVVKGDSLYSISKKYNTTVDNIKKLNNLKSNLLSINQKLIIPT